MVVDDEPYTKDLILLPDRVAANWWRSEGHRLDVDDLKAVFDAAPEVLVVGTGAHGLMQVPMETRQALEAAGIELRVDRTGKAWQTYNELADPKHPREQRRVAGAFHLTC